MLIIFLFLFLFLLIIINYVTNKEGFANNSPFGLREVTTNYDVTTNKVITTKKIKAISIKTISIFDPIDQPDEVLVITIKINKHNSQVYNQVYEDADYIILPDNLISLPNIDAVISNIMTMINNNVDYTSFEFELSKYKTGFPQGKHTILNYNISMAITYAAMFPMQILLGKR